jgi:hypothetical protein
MTEWTGYDEFKEDVEFNETLQINDGPQFEYTEEGSYLGLGGYVVNFDIHHSSVEELEK